jgi:signal transduction histidine kinase
VKEALNNVLKHSQASHVIINIRVDEKLTIEISDDGVGINMDKLRKFGNGLQNMKKRMESIEGDFSIQISQGTKTVLGLVL